MKKLLLISLLSSSFAFSQNFEWAKSIGGTGDDRGNVIRTDVSGNIYLAGAFSGTVDFDPGLGTYNLTSGGDMDIYIAKYDASGNFLWAQSDGGVFDDFVLDIAVDGSGNAYITGYGEINTSGSQRALVIGKIDANGTTLWDHTFTSSSGNVGGYTLTVDASGNVYVGGNFNGTVNFDTSGGTTELTTIGPNLNATDGFVMKLTTGGILQWVKQFGVSAANANVKNISLDGAGNIYSTGQYWNSSLDCDPGAGTAYLGNDGGGDIFIAKWDVNGDYVWAKRMAGSNNEYGFSVKVDASGNVFTSGYFEGTVDFDPGTGTENLTAVGGRDIFISKLDGAGDFQWVKGIGGANTDIVLGMDLDNNGNVYTIGYFEGTVDFDPGTNSNNLTSSGDRDVFISKLNNNGGYVWSEKIGSTDEDSGTSMFLDGNNNVYFAGHFNGTVDFDFGSGTVDLSSSGSRDIFFVKLNQTYAGIEDSNPLEYIAYPNPTSNLLNFSVVLEQVQVYDLSGKLVLSKIGNISQIDLTEVEKGAYLIHLQSINGASIQKIIKE